MTSLRFVAPLVVYTGSGHASAGLRVDTAGGATVWAAAPLGSDDARAWSRAEPPGVELHARLAALAPRVLEGREVSSQAELDAAIDEETRALDAAQRARVRYLLSVAAARACAADRGLPLHQYLAELAGREPDRGLPVPAVTILCGGREWLGAESVAVVPDGLPSLPAAVRAAAEVTAALGALLHEGGEPFAIGDDGGFRARLDGARALERLRAALALTTRAIERAGYALDSQVGLALDAGARRGPASDEPAALCERIAAELPLRFIEDPVDPSAFEAASRLRDRVPGRVRLATRADALPAEERGPWDALLVAPDRIGTVSSTLSCVDRARAAGATPIARARWAETEDVFVADLAAALALPLLRAGGVQRSDRTAKYNQLLRLAERCAPGPAREPGCLGGSA